jgi:hypothetical protein
MGLFDRFTGKKTSRKRTMKEIRYDRILTRQQNQILESAIASNEALKMEVKSLRAVLFSQDELYRELGVEPLPIENNNYAPVSNGDFNTSDLLAQIVSGMNPEKVPMGKVGLQAISEFLKSNGGEINALGSHYMKQMIPKKEIDNQVVTQ